MSKTRKRRALNREERNDRWWAKIIKRYEAAVAAAGPQEPWIRDPVARELETMRRAHEAGNPFGLIDCVLFCDELADHAPLPRWALKALAEEKRAQLTSKGETLRKKMGRHARILEEHKQAHVDYFRYEAVEDAVKHRAELRKLRGGDKFELASQLCYGTPAFASRSMMRRSWKAVRNARRPHRYYLSRYSRYFVPDFSRSVDARERLQSSRLLRSILAS